LDSSGDSPFTSKGSIVFGCHDLQDRQLNEINDLRQEATIDAKISLRMPINIFAFGGHIH
jgi:hypothetical protein